jgi:hypothetical protein
MAKNTLCLAKDMYYKFKKIVKSQRLKRKEIHTHMNHSQTIWTLKKNTGNSQGQMVQNLPGSNNSNNYGVFT